MYKALLPTICLLACTATVRGQQINWPSNGQGTRADIFALTEEQARQFVHKMRILRGADSPTNQPPTITLSQEQIAWVIEIARRLPVPSQDQRPVVPKPLEMTFGGWDSSQGAFSPLGEIRLDLKPIDLEKLTVDLEALKGLSNVPMSPVPPNPACVAGQSYATKPAGVTDPRARTAGFFGDAWRFGKDVWRGTFPQRCRRPCEEARDLCYKKMKAGFYKTDTACEEGYGRCKDTCPQPPPPPRSRRREK